MDSNNNYQVKQFNGRVFYQGKWRKIQCEKGWRFIFYERKKIGLLTLVTEPDLNTVEGWQQLYLRAINPLIQNTGK